MPLKAGKSKAVHAQNVREMVRSFKEKGTIGKTHPKSLKKAVQIANAAAYRKARPR